MRSGRTPPPIPWASPALGEEEERELLDVVRSGRLSMGPKVAAFEEGIARRVGRTHAIATNTGSAALDVALKALGIGPGDEVILPAFTYIATAHAITYQGAIPVPADVDDDTLNLDPRAVERTIRSRTKCIIAIDYGGGSADYDRLAPIAAARGIPLLVDAAHSIGGTRRAKSLGGFGTISTLSFHAAKVLTSIEGGMVLTDSAPLAEICRTLRGQGERPGPKKYVFDRVGSNYRMTDLHAAIGIAQLRKLDTQLAKRRAIAEWYRERLDRAPEVRLPAEPPESEHAWFLYSIRLPSPQARDQVEVALRQDGIDTRICWPAPVHLQPAYAGQLARSASCAVAEAAAQRILSLPIHTALRQGDIDRICERILASLR